MSGTANKKISKNIFKLRDFLYENFWLFTLNGMWINGWPVKNKNPVNVIRKVLNNEPVIVIPREGVKWKLSEFDDDFEGSVIGEIDRLSLKSNHP